jgi:hypothetical protein
MTTTEQRAAVQAARPRPRRANRERQVQQAIDAVRQLADGGRNVADTPIRRDPDPRFAYLTASHD